MISDLVSQYENFLGEKLGENNKTCLGWFQN